MSTDDDFPSIDLTPKWDTLDPGARDELTGRATGLWTPGTLCNGTLDDHGMEGWSCSDCGFSGDWADSREFEGHQQLPPCYTTSRDEAWRVLSTMMTGKSEQERRRFCMMLAAKTGGAVIGIEPIFSLFQIVTFTADMICRAACFGLGVVDEYGVLRAGEEIVP